jgi:hypothetical protein
MRSCLIFSFDAIAALYEDNDLNLMAENIALLVSQVLSIQPFGFT